MENLTTILFSSLVGALVAYIGALLKNIIDTRTKLDESLFQKRTEAYAKLWKTTKEVPKWPKRQNIKFSDLKKYSEKLSSWYYEVGGIFMSRTSQKAYASLQKKIWDSMSENIEKEISDSIYKEICVAGSALRTELTNDLLSRRSAPSI